MQLLPWIKDDIAIEIIGKMIAEQTEILYKVAAEYKEVGFAFDGPEVKADSRYIQAMERVDRFKQEIDRIYEGEELEELYKKVDEVYAPYLKAGGVQGPQPPVEETKGFGFIEHTDNNEMYVPAWEAGEQEKANEFISSDAVNSRSR